MLKAQYNWRSLPPFVEIHWSGQLYNGKALASTLALSDTASANKVLEIAYRKWGQDCVKYFRGDFAFALYDPVKQAVFCGRDIFGCEPLYYHASDKGFYASSSVPQLFEMSDVPRIWSHSALLDTFTLGMSESVTISPQTYHQDIFRLMPGHTLWVQGGKVVQTPYWDLDPQREDLKLASEAEYLEAFQEKLSRAVRCRLHPEHTAMELSGGIDSSLIATTAIQQTQKLTTFSHVRGPQDDCVDEERRARLIVDALGIRSAHMVDAESTDLLAAVQFCAEQFAGPMPYLFYAGAHNIHQAVFRSGHKVLLSGFGGDECVNSHAYGWMKQSLKETGFRNAWQLMQQHHHFKQKPKASLLQGVKVLAGAQLGIWGINPRQRRRAGQGGRRHLNWLHPSLHAQAPKLSGEPYWLGNTVPELERLLLLGKRSAHIRYRVEYSAIIAKALGFTYRYPLLDQELIEFCYALPLEIKKRQGWSRWLARETLRPYLPEEIVHQHDKRDGAIFPAGFNKLEALRKTGAFAVPGSPYLNPAAKQVPKGYESQTIRAEVTAYMIEYAQQQFAVTEHA